MSSNRKRANRLKQQNALQHERNLNAMLKFQLDALKLVTTVMDDKIKALMRAPTNMELLEAAEPFGEFRFGDAQGDKRINYARAVLALVQKGES